MVSISEALLPKFDQEVSTTRKLLEAVPEDRFAWSPHEKSMTLGRLAGHLAELPGWAAAIIDADEFDVKPQGDGESYSPPTFEKLSDILTAFDENTARARALIAAKRDAEMMAPWTLKKEGSVQFSVPRVGAIESFLIHHLIHHRGQLSVYLRLLDVPVPQIYGPTADFPDF